MSLRLLNTQFVRCVPWCLNSTIALPLGQVLTTNSSGSLELFISNFQWYPRYLISFSIFSKLILVDLLHSRRLISTVAYSPSDPERRLIRGQHLNVCFNTYSPTVWTHRAIVSHHPDLLLTSNKASSLLWNFPSNRVPLYTPHWVPIFFILYPTDVIPSIKKCCAPFPRRIREMDGAPKHIW